MIVVDGNGIALEVGDLKVAGIVLVGALSTHLPFDGRDVAGGDRAQRAAEVEGPELRRIRGRT